MQTTVSTLQFIKYSAAGNDFIMMDNRQGEVETLSRDGEYWHKMCQRRTGIGADGVIFVDAPLNSTGAVAKMRYLNADGGEVDMCGNGLRSMAYFLATECGLGPAATADSEKTITLQTKKGIYLAILQVNSKRELKVQVQMSELYDLNRIDLNKLDILRPFKNKMYLNTGVPHCVLEVDDVEKIDMVQWGRQIRQHPIFAPEGVNVNFFSQTVVAAGGEKQLRMRTYERGVEDETLACGTGVVAVGVADAHFKGVHDTEYKITMKGGPFILRLEKEFKSIFLSGEVQKIFTGKIEMIPS